MKELFFQVFVAVMTACAQNQDMGFNYQAVDKSMESVLSSEVVSTIFYTTKVDEPRHKVEPY